MKLLLHAIAAGAIVCMVACAGKSTQGTPLPMLPMITSQPQNAVINVADIGTQATFSVEATNGAHYQWSSALFSGTGSISAWAPITAATSSTYAVTTTKADIGRTPLPLFRVEVLDATRTLSSTSAAASLSISVPVGYPFFTTQPAPVIANPGTDATFTVVNSGVPAPTFQWQKKPAAGVWADVAGATGATLIVPAVTVADNGALLRCVATNSAGTNASDEAKLTVGVELLANKGFEDGQTQTAWTTSGGGSKASWTGKMIGDSTATSRLTVRTGAFYLYLGNISGAGSDFAYQDVTIDAAAVSANLTYAWAIRVGSTTTAVGDVTLKVEIRDPLTNTVLATALTKDAKTHGSATSPAPWQPLETFNLLPYKGQTVRIYFTSASIASYAYIGVDDVSVVVAK
ncbi:MAG: hypothetical protein IPP58_11240 [Holophagaceae bacterium]|uniref:Ig-like domain-containing protein n=1 Tax=Candidatus Geothrix skivensis TaxID=2954439 RepID=A0A9D7SJE9_9BACT|nr:hypothetical protein [Candidatus Geothrix skivensis]